MHLFLHGFLGSKEDWSPILNLLPEGIAIDLPLIEKDIPAVLHAKYPKADLLVGYSAGGRIALEMHARYPGAYKQVVVFSTHPGLYDPEERKERKKREQTWIEMLQMGSFLEFLKEWYAQPLFSSFRKSEAFQETLKRRAQGNPANWARFLELYGSSVRSPAEIDPRTIFVCGSEDLKYVSLYRKLNFFIIPDAGHVIHLEQPVLCAKLLETIKHDNY